MNSSNKPLIISIVNTLVFVGMVIINILANVLPINNITTGEVSDSYPTIITPAGYTFSIWGLIYILLGLYCIQAIRLALTEQNSTAYAHSYLLIIANSMNIVWIFLWHYNLITYTIIPMLGILISLLMLHLMSNIEYSEFPVKEIHISSFPISIYLGWISFAIIGNVAIVLTANDIQLGWTDSYWTMTVLIFALFIAIFMMALLNDVGFVMVFIWAFIGVVVKQNALENPDYLVIGTSISAIVLLIFEFVFFTVRMITTKKKVISYYDKEQCERIEDGFWIENKEFAGCLFISERTVDEEWFEKYSE